VIKLLSRVVKAGRKGKFVAIQKTPVGGAEPRVMVARGAREVSLGVLRVVKGREGGEQGKILLAPKTPEFCLSAGQI